MYSMEMGFCHHAMCMGVHIIFLSPVLVLTFVIIVLKCVPLSVSLLREKLEAELTFSKRKLKRMLVGGLPWEDLQAVLT